MLHIVVFPKFLIMLMLPNRTVSGMQAAMDQSNALHIVPSVDTNRKQSLCSKIL